MTKNLNTKLLSVIEQIEKIKEEHGWQISELWEAENDIDVAITSLKDARACISRKELEQCNKSRAFYKIKISKIMKALFKNFGENK